VLKEHNISLMLGFVEKNNFIICKKPRGLKLNVGEKQSLLNPTLGPFNFIIVRFGSKLIF
jgi:hypothetical protein